MKKRKTLRRIGTVAAVTALTAALTTLAVAANLFGLRDLLLPQQSLIPTVDENGMKGEAALMDVISLSGFMDTPESKALAEWNAFYESYDPDGSIIASIGNQPTGLEERYGLYTVYTREMADKLEEIAGKYGLRLHTEMAVVLPEMWDAAAGTPFLYENNTAWSGYIYEDGTFHFDGEAQISGYGRLDYQFRRAVYGSFHDVILNVGDLSRFQEWTYETACGVAVSLGLGAERSLIAADLGDSFLLVNVLAGKETDLEDVFSTGPVSVAELEALADSFDLNALTPVKTPDLPLLEQMEQEILDAMAEGPAPEPEEDTLYMQTGIETEAAKAFVQGLVELLEKGGTGIAEQFAYPCLVTVPDGTYTVNSPQELLPYYDEAITWNLKTLIADLETGELFGHDGLVGVGDGTVWFGLVEDGDIRLFTLQTDGYGVRPVEGVTAG